MRGFVKDYGGEVVVEDDEDVGRGFGVAIALLSSVVTVWW